MPLSARLQHEGGGQLLSREVLRCAEIAGSVHDVPRRSPAIAVRIEPRLRPDVGGSFDSGSAPPEIALNGFRTDVGLSLLHELGHYIDIVLLGDGERGASGSDARLTNWRGSITESAGVGRLLEGLDAHEAFGSSLAENFLYLLDFAELFARSYAQWIIECSADDYLGQLLADTLRAEYPDQWTASDFRPIARELDALFNELRWN